LSNFACALSASAKQPSETLDAIRPNDQPKHNLLLPRSTISPTWEFRYEYIWWNFLSSRRERIEQTKETRRPGRFAHVPEETEFHPSPGELGWAKRRPN